MYLRRSIRLVIPAAPRSWRLAMLGADLPVTIELAQLARAGSTGRGGHERAAALVHEREREMESGDPGQGPLDAGGLEIFLTTAIPVEGANDSGVLTSTRSVPTKFTVMCLDRGTGKVLWQRTATTQMPHEGFHNTYRSFASNTPGTDGEHVYACFCTH